MSLAGDPLAEPVAVALLTEPVLGTNVDIGPGQLDAYLLTPLAFEANLGQTDTTVDFMARGSGYAVFLTDGDAVLKLDGGDLDYVVRLNLLSARSGAVSTGEELLAGRSNYFLGGDSSQWVTDVENFAAVRYEDIYDGIDVRYYGTNQRQLEYDFILAAGADPGQIRLDFEAR